MKPNRPLPKGVKRYSENAEKVFTGVRFDTYQWQQKMFDGTDATFEIVKRNDTVVVIPIIDGEVVLVKEMQPHWTEARITCVAGGVEPDEELESAARRELEEETGLMFEHFELVYIEPIVPAVEWTAYTFVAYGFKEEREKKLDAGEKNEVVRLNFKELLKIINERGMFYPPRFLEDFLIRDKVGELEDFLKNPSKYKLDI